MKTRNLSKNPMTKKECLEAINDQKLQHTPVPWKLQEEFNGDIFGPENQWIAKVVDVRKTESKTNAAFIVRAVNAHADLVFACKEALMRLQSIVGDQSQIVPKGIQARLAKAIAKAESR